MRHIVLVLLAGLLAFTFAGQNTNSTPRAGRPDRSHLNPDSIRVLHARGRALPSGLDVDDVIRQARSGRKPGTPRPLQDDPFDSEFLPAPATSSAWFPGEQKNASVASDGSGNYLVVWQDNRNSAATGYDIYGARVAVDGTVLDWNGGILISGAGGDQQNPTVAYGDGSYLVAWEDFRVDEFGDIYGARLDKTTGGVSPLSSPISAADYDQQIPCVAYDKDANYLVVWQDGSGSDYDILGARVSSSGGTPGTPFAISAYQDEVGQTAPSVAFDDTAYLVAWQIYGSGTAGDIHGALVGRDGTVHDNDIEICVEGHNQFSPSVASNGTNFLVVWEDHRNIETSTGVDIYGALVTDVDDGITVAELDPISEAVNAQVSPSVAFDGANYLAVWEDFRGYDHNPLTGIDIYGQRLNASGVLQGSAIVISEATIDEQAPAAAFNGVNYLVVWQGYRFGNNDVYGARVETDGDVLDGNGILMNPAVNAQTYPAVACDDQNGRYLVVWEDNRGGYYDIYGSVVKADGTPVASDFLISDDAEYVDDYFPSVAFDGTRYLVVWTSIYDQIYGALVDKDGVVLGDPGIFMISTYDAFFPESPSVASDGNGNFLVAWLDWRGDNADIYGALVNFASQNLTVTQLPDPISDAVNAQEKPAIAFDGTNYLVVWQDYRNSWDIADIYGARVSTAGVVQDADGIEITTAAGNQRYASVASDQDPTDPHCLVVWQDNRWGDRDILGARLDKDGAVLDTGALALPIATAEGSDQCYPGVAFNGVNYVVAWTDGYTVIDGCQMSPAGRLVEKLDGISTRTSAFPAVACEEGTALVAYHSVTNDVNEDAVTHYYGVNRIWARPGTLPRTTDVGTDVLLRPDGSFILEGSAPILPRAKVGNYGSSTQSFTVTLSISPADTGYSSERTVSDLAPGNTATVDFDAFDLETNSANLYTATCQTSLADDNPDNDAQTSYFQGSDTVIYFDLAGEDFTTAPSTGHWDRNEPQTPWPLPPMSTIAWGDRLDGNYDNDENSTLTSPEFTATDNYTWIAFQHCFRTEAGQDGGNFWYSTSSWYDSVAPTYSGGMAYNGSVEALGGQGWSGNSEGWKQSVFRIPVAKNATFKVRWHLKANGDANTSKGWLIDEVALISSATSLQPAGSGPVIDNVKVWPYLIHGVGQVNYTLVRNCNVTINLYDATGRLAQRVPTSGFKKGPNTAKLDASGLARGVYFVKVKGETDSQTTKVIIE
jgi:hypothetical protein